MTMTTTSKGSGDDACAEESTVSVVASSPSQEESDEELGSEPSSQATKEVTVGELPSGSGEHDDDEDGSAACPNVPMKDNADEPSTNKAAASPFSPPPPRPRKRGRALPTSSTARTSSSSRKSQQRSKEFSDASDFSQEDDHYYIDEDEAEAFLSTSSNLAYSWDALGLGHKLGSPALNRYMARFNEKSPQQQLTAQQTLQIVNSLQLRTIMPPEFSALHRIIQRVRGDTRVCVLPSVCVCVWTHNIFVCITTLLYY